MIDKYLGKGGVEDISGGDVSIDDISHYHNHLRYFLHASILLSIESAKFWPTLAHFDYFVANLRTFCCAFYRPE